jgi:hypothetical protein
MKGLELLAIVLKMIRGGIVAGLFASIIGFLAVYGLMLAMHARDKTVFFMGLEPLAGVYLEAIVGGVIGLVVSYRRARR